MATFACLEGGRSTGVPPNLHPTAVDLVDDAKLPVGNTAFAVRRGHLHAVASGKVALAFAIKRHTLQPSRIVADTAVVVGSDRHLIRLRVNAFDPCVVASFDADSLAAAA